MMRHPAQKLRQNTVAVLVGIFMCLIKLLRLGRYAYLLRVPIILGMILFVIPFVALPRNSPVHALLQNLFFMEGSGILWSWPIFWSTTAALVLAWSLLLTSRLILLNCGDRLGVQSCMTVASLRGRPVFTILLLSLPLILGPLTQQVEFHTSHQLLLRYVISVIGAAFGSYLIAFAALWCAVVLAPSHTQGSAVTFACVPLMRRWLIWADHFDLMPQRITLGVWVRKHLPRSLWQGYLAANGFVWSGHWLAFLFGLATMALYFFVGWWHGRYLGEQSGISALTFVLLLLLNVNWILAATGFFLDRFRIPLLTPLVVFALISGNTRNSDHYFKVRHVTIEDRALSPAEVLRVRADKPIVLIATAGGGIQAAAWTTQVLAGLEEQYRHWYPGKSFSKNIAVISSVSGGAVGSMFYLNLYHSKEQQHFRVDRLAGLTDLAARSSLDDVAWAFIYHDLPGILIPWQGNTQDRGVVLEETWSKRAQLYSMLSEWRRGVAEGWRPATIFNSTIAETGEPLALATTTEKSNEATHTTAEPPRLREFYDLYPGKDLSVVTAVRLSATFPFVSPAARPDTQRPNEYHMIDGGYYDNYGVASLIAWMDDGLRVLEIACERKATGVNERRSCGSRILPRILVLQIRSFPSDKEVQPTKKGWAFQLYAPFQGLLSVRTTAQLVGDREALMMFARRWEPHEAGTKLARIHFATFEFGDSEANNTEKFSDPPLSWAMNPGQIQAVKDDWNIRVAGRMDSASNDANIEKVHCFFEPHLAHCQSLSNEPE